MFNWTVSQGEKAAVVTHKGLRTYVHGNTEACAPVAFIMAAVTDKQKAEQVVIQLTASATKQSKSTS